MEIFRFPFRAMGSVCEIVIADESHERAAHAALQATKEVLRIERKYSRYDSESIISRINAAAGKEKTICDEETWELFNYADQLFELSDGLFDITAGILRQAWDFKQNCLPELGKLNALCELIDWRKFERQALSVYLPMDGMEIDFGGFGKEYAADKAARVLETLGAKNAYVNLGGDIHVIGPKADGSPWVIGIQHPRDVAQIIASIPVHQGGLATSGDYEKYIEIDGKRYCHILNPRTGMPVSHWTSVSVLAPMSLMAGSYTTIAMLKEKQAVDFLNEAKVSYFTVDMQGDIRLQK